MRYDKGRSVFAYQAAATASVTLTAATRDVMIETIDAWSLESSAIVTVSRSGTVVWQGETNSAGTGRSFVGLCIESNGESTLSANVGSTTSGIISVFGRYVDRL